MIRGRKILVNPAGGLILHQELNRWIFQRDYINGVVPDTLAIDFANPLSEMLEVVGANVYYTRDINRFSGIGESNQPKWHEGSCSYLKGKKIPSEIWDKGDTAIDKDVNARLNYADYIKVDCIVTLNFSVSSEQGMEFWYNNPDAKRMAESIRDNVMRLDKKYSREKFLKEDVHKEHPVVCQANMPSVEICIFNLQNVSEGWLANQAWEKSRVTIGIFGGIYRMFE